MKALILSAGLGSRLRPLTLSVPKPLVTINSKPTIDFIIDRLLSAGVDEFAFNLHYLPEQIQKHVLARLEGKAYFKFEETLLDTGGSIASFKKWALEDKFLIVHNGDIFTTLDVKSLIDEIERCDAVLGLVGGKPSANVLFRPGDGKIVDMRGKLKYRNGDALFLTFSGVAVYSSSFIKAMPEGQYSIVDFIVEKIADSSKNIHGVFFEDVYWSDIGDMESLEKTRRDVAYYDKTGNFKRS